MRGAVPERARADQRERLGDVVAAGSHVGRAPGGERDRARPLAVLLDVALDQQRRRLPAQMPGGGRRHGAAVERDRSSARSAARPSRPRVGAPHGPGSTKRPSRAFRTPSISARPLASTAGRMRRSICSRTTRLARQRGSGASSRGDQVARAELEALERVAVGAPGLIAQTAQNLRPVALPGRGQGAVERIEASKLEIARERPEQRGITALARAPRHPHQGDQEIAQLIARGRRAEHVQAVSDLQLLQLAEMVVELGQRLPGAVVRVDAEVAIQAEAPAQRQDLVAQPGRAARVDAGGLVVFVDQALELAERPIGLGAGQAVASGDRRSPRPRAAWPGCPRPDRSR